MKRLILFFAAVVGIWACVEEPTSPARCPDFCPGTKLAAIESIFVDAISRDSFFEGYISPLHAGLLSGTSESGIDSRPISRFGVFPAFRQQLDSVDTLTGPIVIDSMKMTVTFLRPDTASRNLRFSIYQLPDSLDSTKTFADLAPSFAGSPLRVVNVDSLLRQASRRDSILGDTVLLDGASDTTDGSRTTHIVKLRLKFDSAQATAHLADSGRFSVGFIVTADNRPTVAFGASELGLGLSASWFYRVDSSGKLLRPDSIFYKNNCSASPCTHVHPPDSLQTSVGEFDSFVYTAPALTPDSNLWIGGIPSRRALLRINFPKVIRDSTQVLRAELFLIPTATAPLVTDDSVMILVSPVAADFGLKSPVEGDTIQGQSAPFKGNPTDTVRIEVTNIYRNWQSDTTKATSVYLRLMSFRRQAPSTTSTADTAGRFSGLEGATFTTLRFYSSRTPAFRPVVKLTYVPRLKLGVP